MASERSGMSVSQAGYVIGNFVSDALIMEQVVSPRPPFNTEARRAMVDDCVWRVRARVFDPPLVISRTARARRWFAAALRRFAEYVDAR